MASASMIRIAAMGDLHCTASCAGQFQTLFREASRSADVLVLCGDLTDYGREEEARVLAEELRVASIPVVAVLGNHDHETGKANEVIHILGGVGVHVLDGSTFELDGVAGFAGVKGFVGGFGRRALTPWGEDSLKKVVFEGMEEALKLERAMSKLWTPIKIAVLHYSPIEATVQGEAPEIKAFLGSSRLEEAVDRYRASVVVHGHAHRGSPVGRTRSGITVHNVAMPVLRRSQPDKPAFKLIEVHAQRNQPHPPQPERTPPPPSH